MIIDLILNRKAGTLYNPEHFYRDVLGYHMLTPNDSDNICRAMDCGTESDIKAAICDYITGNDYNPDICEYVNSVSWLAYEPAEFYCRANIVDDDTGAVVFEIGKVYTAKYFERGCYWIPVPGEFNSYVGYYPGAEHDKYFIAC